MTVIRRFTADGLTRFEEILDHIQVHGDADVDALVYDPSITTVLGEAPELNIHQFESRFEAGKYFHHLFEETKTLPIDVERDRALWSWLAAAWMDVIAPAIGGKRDVGEQARWVLSADYRRYYRHLLAGPFRIYRAHRDNPTRAMVVLANPVGKPGEVVEQLASRQHIVSNPAMLRALTELYFDAQTGKLRRGSGGKGAGSPRRLAYDILPQFDLTWDFFVMDPEEILALLPSEFDRFRME